VPQEKEKHHSAHQDLKAKNPSQRAQKKRFIARNEPENIWGEY